MVVDRPFHVLATTPLHAIAAATLGQDCMLEVAPDETPSTLRRLIRDADALIVRTRLPEDIFEDAPNLRACVRHGIGLDFIPVAEASARGIPVANLPDANTHAVIEYVVAAMLFLTRGLHRVSADLRSDGWLSRLRVNGLELRGRCAGIVGLGRIGRGVAAALAHGFGMTVLGYEPRRKADLPNWIRPVTLQQLFSQSDFITLHAPLTTDTRKLIDDSLLRQLKRGAFLINAARGALIDDAALIDALRSGLLAGAVIDVFDEQPLPAAHPFFGIANLTLTPHIASFTEDALMRMGRGAATAVLRILAGQVPESLVNPEVWPGYLQRWSLAS